MEKLFSLFWKTQTEKKRLSPGYLDFDDNLLKFEMFVKMVAPFKMNGELGRSLWSVGFVGSDLLLPKDICWTVDPILNAHLVQLLILKSIAIKELGLTFEFHDRERTAPRLYVLSQMALINLWLDQQYPLFQSFQKDIFLQFEYYLPKIKGPVLSYWRKQILSRSLETDSTYELKGLLIQQKRNDEIPDYLHAWVPLPFRELSKSTPTTNLMHGKKDSIENQTQKQRNQKEFTEDIDLNKQGSVNPVLHSFEKMETADDYEGGRRVESGDDELENHQNSLEELELNRHTLAGEASSFYRQDSSQIKLQNISSENLESKQAFQYPEWSYRDNKYLKSFCSVFPSSAEEKNEGESLSQFILIKYQTLISVWKLKINSLVNTPKWKNRLIEGSEIDLDSFIRLNAELKLFSGRPRIFSEKQKIENDFSILILADVSYSTDTWIDGQKVIDVIKNSIAVASYVFEDIFDKVSVAITSSQTRRRIEYKELKDFSESWRKFFRRSHEIIPNQYTRLGPAIRHATKRLEDQNTLKRILILITDGKPTDLDPYEGLYGQRDVRKALDEAKNAGIHTLTLTISDFDPISLQKTFERPCSVKNPDDFCREVFSFIWNLFLKKCS